MVDVSGSLYSGTIDWNFVYKKYYPIDEIERNIEAYLADGGDPSVTIAGFAEVAERLSRRHRLEFVEYSSFMVEEALKHFPSLKNIKHDDILQYISKYSSDIVFITSRISANWTSLECIDQLIDGIKSFPRKKVLVDFFDFQLIKDKEVVQTGLDEKSMVWSTEGYQVLDPKLNSHIVRWRGEYVIAGRVIKYTDSITAFEPSRLLAYMREKLTGYQISIELPLIPNDPGFSILITSESNCD